MWYKPSERLPERDPENNRYSIEVIIKFTFRKIISNLDGPDIEILIQEDCYDFETKEWFSESHYDSDPKVELWTYIPKLPEE